MAGTIWFFTRAPASATGTVANTLPSLTQAATGKGQPEATGTAASPLPSLTQSVTIRQFTDWSATASDTTSSGVVTQVLVVTVGV